MKLFASAIILFFLYVISITASEDTGVELFPASAEKIEALPKTTVTAVYTEQFI